MDNKLVPCGQSVRQPDINLLSWTQTFVQLCRTTAFGNITHSKSNMSNSSWPMWPLPKSAARCMYILPSTSIPMASKLPFYTNLRTGSPSVGYKLKAD